MVKAAYPSIASVTCSAKSASPRLGRRAARATGSENAGEREEDDERDQERPDRPVPVAEEKSEAGDAEHPAEEGHRAAERPVGNRVERPGGARGGPRTERRVPRRAATATPQPRRTARRGAAGVSSDRIERSLRARVQSDGEPAESVPVHGRGQSIEKRGRRSSS